MRVIGLMSGTSGDGIDAALCEISGEPPGLYARIVFGKTFPYPHIIRDRILRACLLTESSVDQLCILNSELGTAFANAALEVIHITGLNPSDIDLIASHGQTVWHQVSAENDVQATLQIGEAANIAEKTGITTISNFRARDVAAGGQGAPLTSYVDWLVLRSPDHWRAIQNIGGIANVTLLPPLYDKESSPIAFDTGPGNALIDVAVNELTEGKEAFDRNGHLAGLGQVDKSWLSELLSHSYYQRQPPKTTGRELFGTDTGRRYVREGIQRGLSTPDIVATLTMLTARTIADAYHAHFPLVVGEVILGGGGCRNQTLVHMISELLHPIPIRTHEDVGIDSDLKEALVFAVLGYETWHARPGILPVLTGAKHPVVLGQITPGQNYVDLLKKTWTQV